MSGIAPSAFDVPPGSAERNPISPRERVLTALRHQEPDRVPVDFLATPEIWNALIERLNPSDSDIGPSEYVEARREALLRLFDVDCRVLSYDMFCNPPESALQQGAVIDWWQSLSRSTPNRMWRQVLPDGHYYDIWGHHLRLVHHPSGAYEEFASWPLGAASSVDDLKGYDWPQPTWWDFSALPSLLAQLNRRQPYHCRFRIGSVFELAWQLRGMQEFLMDLAVEPDIPLYIMDRLVEVHVENLKRVLDLCGDQLDMVYFYDDVATQNSLLISQEMWRKYIRPYHARLIAMAQAYHKPVMYHCDGALYPLIPELIEMGVDLLNPIQADAKGMDPSTLKSRFGDRLAFHGGIDIIKTLPSGSVDDVMAEVRERVHVLADNGGYILASSHHIQADTPLDNIIAMYGIGLRYR